MKIFSAPQINEWDQFTISKENITSLDLMERAAKACADWFVKHYSFQTVHIFCGPGNNGGDGLAIARMLHQRNYPVNVYTLKTEKTSSDFDANLQQLPLKPQPIHSAIDFPELKTPFVVIDALFGTGLNKPVIDLAEELIIYLNNAEADVISIDSPSGLFADKSSLGNNIITATHTLSFQCNKLAFMLTENLPYTGQIHLLDIGLKQEYYHSADTNFYTIEKELIQKIYQPRKKWVHKYQLGHALIYAGSKNMMGAALLCSKACIKSGAGLVTLHLDSGQMPVLYNSIPEIIASDENDVNMIMQKKKVIAFGPGLEKDEDHQLLLKEIINNWNGSMVIDASGLSMLRNHFSLLKKRPANKTILTPHTGEFETLFGKCDNDFDRMNVALKKAAEYQIYIILKAPHTLVVCPDGTIFFNTTGNSGMATAGSGDVLTGIVTALLAQSYSEKYACLFAVYLHGLAADIAAKELSKEAMIASDIIDKLAPAFKSFADETV